MYVRAALKYGGPLRSVAHKHDRVMKFNLFLIGFQYVMCFQRPTQGSYSLCSYAFAKIVLCPIRGHISDDPQVEAFTTSYVQGPYCLGLLPCFCSAGTTSPFSPIAEDFQGCEHYRRKIVAAPRTYIYFTRLGMLLSLSAPLVAARLFSLVAAAPVCLLSSSNMAGMLDPPPY